MCVSEYTRHRCRGQQNRHVDGLGKNRFVGRNRCGESYQRRRTCNEETTRLWCRVVDSNKTHSLLLFLRIRRLVIHTTIKTSSLVSNYKDVHEESRSWCLSVVASCLCTSMAKSPACVLSDDHRRLKKYVLGSSYPNLYSGPRYKRSLH